MNAVRIVAVVAALLGAALVGGVAGAIVTATQTESTETTTVAAARNVEDGQTSLAELYKEVSPSVVEIETAGAELGPLGPLPRGGTGTGWIFDAEGHVVTNHHVVDGAESVTVRFADGREVDADVVATDPSTDVAVLRLEDTDDLAEALELGSSEDLEIGDPVIAIGSPFGLDGSLTTGVVSGLGRTIRAPNEFAIDDVVQTDAALNPGNSGGPLLDSAGRVVGMNAQIASETGGNAGVGYAIPIDTVESVVGQLLEDGEVRHPYLGVRLADAEDGARVVEVVNGGPADDAGLRVGDVIVGAGGDEVTSADDVRQAVTDREPGDELELEVRRGENTREVTAELGTRPSGDE